MRKAYFFLKDNNDNRFIINSEHGPKGGDEVNINHLKNNRVLISDGHSLIRCEL